jgi:Putative transposase/Transposase zinc-binding domain
VPRPILEVADIFRDFGAAWRRANAGHVSRGQLKVMSAIERCRTAALGGHVARCETCPHTIIAYNSCRNRHCPKCQGAAAKEWLAERQAELLPVPYFHVVFTLPASIADIAYQNKAVIYDILFKASADATITIAADPKHLGARVGVTSVLHSWGSAMTHHPHVHMIVAGGGLSEDGSQWVSCRPNFFLAVRVLSRLFRRLVLQMLIAAHQAGRLQFFGAHAALADTNAFAAFLAPLRRSQWVVYSKKPFGGPQAVLAYLARYTHRVAIANRRLIAADAISVTFKYRITESKVPSATKP